MRSINTIFQSLLSEKENLTTLNALTSNSITDEDTLIQKLTDGQCPEWVLWLYNFAVASNVVEGLIDNSKNIISENISNLTVGTANWYITMAKQFQYGYELTLDPVTYQISYATTDVSSQIIASCTVKLIGNEIYLKVRRIDNELLSTSELSAFESYINQIKPAGTHVFIENYEPDQITLEMDIYYYANYDKTTIQTAVELAINTYLENIEYDSVILINKIIDALQNITGIYDIRVTNAEAIDSIGNSYTFTYEYTTNAGWAIINPTYPLSDTITYIAK